jgi:hypothetical protein
MSRSILTDTRCDEIKQEVLFLYEECEVHTYPIDCFAIATKLYYVLRPYSSLDCDEYARALRTDPDGYSKVEVNPATGMNQYVIYYNDNALLGRMRWTILHEIGHIYLGHHDHPDESLSEIEEAEAEFFAKYAIANPPLICISHCQGPEDIEATFETSHTAAVFLFDYFKKWLYYGPQDYLPFERQIIELFQAA